MAKRPGETDAEYLDRTIAMVERKSTREEGRFTNSYEALSALEEREASLVEELEKALDPDNNTPHRPVEQIAMDLVTVRGAGAVLRGYLDTIRPEANRLQESLKVLKEQRAAL